MSGVVARSKGPQCTACLLGGGDRRRANRARYAGHYVTGEGGLFCVMHAEQACDVGGWMTHDLDEVALPMHGRVSLSNDTIRLARPRPASLDTIKEELRREITRDVLAEIAGVYLSVELRRRPGSALRAVEAGRDA